MHINVKYVNPPKPGARSGSIKTDGGEYIGFDPNKFAFNPGQSYEVEVSETTRNGKTYRDVVAIKSNGAAPTGNGGGVAVGGGGAPWYLPFVSNTVAHAIAAGRIEKPEDIWQWAEGARDSAQSLLDRGEA